MLLNKSQSAKILIKAKSILRACVQQGFRLNSYERETLASIGKSLEQGLSATDKQGQFIDNLAWRMRKWQRESKNVNLPRKIN